MSQGHIRKLIPSLVPRESEEVTHPGPAPGFHSHAPWTQLQICPSLVFPGWVEPFLCATEKATEVTGVFLSEIVFLFALPKSVHWDNGVALKAEITEDGNY